MVEFVYIVVHVLLDSIGNSVSFNHYKRVSLASLKLTCMFYWAVYLNTNFRAALFYLLKGGHSESYRISCCGIIVMMPSLTLTAILTVCGEEARLWLPLWAFTPHLGPWKLHVWVSPLHGSCTHRIQLMDTWITKLVLSSYVEYWGRFEHLHFFYVFMCMACILEIFLLYGYLASLDTWQESAVIQFTEAVSQVTYVNLGPQQDGVMFCKLSRVSRVFSSSWLNVVRQNMCIFF